MRAIQKSFKRHSLSLAAAAALAVASAPASAATCTWNTTSGNWNALTNWLSCVAGNGNPGGTPGANDSASIGAAGVVTVNSAQRIGAIANAGSLIVDGSSLRVTGGITGSGSTTVQSGGLLNLEGTQTVGGNATLVFGTGGNNRIGIDGGGAVITFAAGTTVRGQSGSIGLGQLVNGSGNSVVNQGLISSDSGGTITIVQSGLTNQAIAEATGAGSVLSLQSNVNNTGGTLRATAGGLVRQEGVTVSGGTISTSGGGSYQFSNSGGNYLSGVTFASGSAIDMASTNSLARVTNGMTLNGTISVNSNSRLNFEGDQTLSGSGSIVLGSAGSNIIGIDGGNKTLTVASGVTIRGENGFIGLGQLVNGSGNTLVNNGTIAADVAGGTITLLGLGGGITNNGTISASNGGTLALQSNLTGGTGSQLVAGAGSVISQQGVTISGIVNTSGSGNLRPTNSGNNYLSGVTLNGSLDMASATALERVVGNLVLNGTINVNNSSRLNFEGDQSLSGNGSIVFGSAGSNIVGVDGGNKTLTVASGITIRGENGTIGLGQLVNGSGNALVNNGNISADVAGGTITLQGLGAGITNNGTISALNGGTLQLQSNLVGAPGGQLVAGSGSLILQQGVTISGVVNTSGSGNLRPSNSVGNYLSGVTLNGNLDMAGATSLERVVGNLVLNGNIAVNNSSLLNFEGNQTLSGNGSIVFGSTAGNNRIGVDGGNRTLTVASGITIRGQNGSIGLGQLVNGSGNTLVNQGLISSDSGGTLNIAQSTFVNQSFAEAVGAGSLLRLDSTVDNSAGTLRSTAGGVVLQNGVTVTGGSITNSGGATYRLSNASNYLSGVTLTSGSNIDMASATALGRVINGMTVNGTLNIDNSSLLNMEGDQTLAGTGSVVFGAGANNRIGVDGGNRTLTIASGVTVRGQNGSIGLGQLVNGSGNAVINNGVINSDGGGTITVQGLGNGLQNNGLVRAQNGALNVSNALSGSGTLQVDATGSMQLAAGAKTQGTLAMGAAGAALNLNTGNLTLSTDYTNVGAGSGNSFNRRAGVTGTGQIVAGGNAAQVITGASVTGGGTPNATLTIGNVRVGANTFDYTVANSGSTGPTLRGAVQTSVNGANLSDARLSGSGVTASNYNAGAPAGAGETRSVTFTAGSAGALAPMSGQVLNLRSNFDNIADQKLNIVLGSGAAAYNAAVGSTATPVQIANQRVGGTGSATLTVSNTASPGAFSEDLNTTIASTGGQATASGSVLGRLAGTSNTGSGAITVGVNTATAGAITGVVNLNYQSTGTVGGVSNGLAAIGVGGQTVTVNGNVYQTASGQITSAPLNFGTVQVGQVVTQNLAIRNTATGAAGFVEDLHASFGSTSGTGAGLISGTGSLSGITAGSTSNAGNGTMTVSVNTASAGTVNGSIAVNYVSAGAVGGVSNGLGTLAVGSDSYGVAGTIQASANVINQASPLLNTPTINLGAVRVGAASPSGTVSVTNMATVAPQAALNASIAPNAGPITASGSFNLLNPGATNSTSLVVGLNTNTAGNFTGGNAGTATISFVSDASNVGNCAPNCQLNLASQNVAVEGKVYTQASGAASGTSINFGVVRVGDTVSAGNITINNTAASTALNDTLRADLSGVGGAFSGNGGVSGVAAQGSASLAVGLSTGTAGVFNSSGSIAFTSQNADMADVSAGADATVSLIATVNNLANGDFDLVAGAGVLTDAAGNYTLDLGTLVLGASVNSQLQLDNDVAGPADELSGSFNLAGADDFSYSGWTPLSMLSAGAASGALNISWLAGALGQFSDTIVFNGLGTNASDTTGLAQTRTLTIRANVINVPPAGVPEPGTLALLLAAATASWAARRGALRAQRRAAR